MFRRLRTIVTLAGVAAALPQFVWGQAAAINGEIIGAVTDPSGKGVARAIVQIINPATGLKQAVRTEDSGLYRFFLLPIGTYDLTAQSVGFAEARCTTIVVDAGAAV